MTQSQVAILVAALGAFISLVVAVISRMTQKDLEQLKAGLEEKKSEKDARRDYEYEARKRLYQECEPLLFELYELSENALHRIYSLARSARKGNLGLTGSWLDSPGYYMASTIYNLLAPIAVYKLIQRRLTFVDLTVEPHIRSQYILAKLIAVSFTDDFDFARCTPQRPYSPNDHAWQALRKTDPAQYWKQGIPLGRLDVAAEGLILQESSGSLRLRSFGEFETEYHDKKSTIGTGFSSVTDMFLGFHPKFRPCLWRMLITQAHIYEALLKISQGGGAEPVIALSPIPQNRRNLFEWRQKAVDATDEDVLVEPFSVAAEYLKMRIGPQLTLKLGGDV